MIKMTNLRNTPIVYGPVPSRRPGHSLGINNIPEEIEKIADFINGLKGDKAGS